MYREGVLQMKQQKRRHYTEAEKAFMWDRWQKGDSMRDIGGLARQLSMRAIATEPGRALNANLHQHTLS